MGLIVKDRYTVAAELLADRNENPRSAISLVRFGKTDSIFIDRSDIASQSLLTQYFEALKMFDTWYRPYEEVVGFERVKRIQIPREAFREAIANAFVNRRYDVNGAVQVFMFEDRIEILSPGGLPEGMSEVSYLYSCISLPRNLVVANVLQRINIIEKLGTGIERIRKAYADFPSAPRIDVTGDFIRTILPVIRYEDRVQEESLREKILRSLAKRGALTRVALEKITGYRLEFTAI